VQERQNDGSEHGLDARQPGIGLLPPFGTDGYTHRE
jgi:hypothetical protein